MSREAWGDPTDQGPELCPLCGEQSHAAGCELGAMQARALDAERDARRLRRMLALRSGIPHLYCDDGEASGQEHGISIDFLREPVADIEAKLLALNLARFKVAEGEPPSSRWQTSLQK